MHCTLRVKIKPSLLCSQHVFFKLTSEYSIKRNRNKKVFQSGVYPTGMGFMP